MEQGCQAAVRTYGLRKEYGRTVAVEDLTLQVEQGEVFGFLGPNGAGKTTSIKMLLGLVQPTAGEAQLLGISVSEPASRQEVGFLPEHFRFQEWMKATEFLQAHGKLYGLSSDERKRRAEALLERVGLSYAADRRLAAFSKGMLQRIGLAQALLHRPRLVFLDEPTSGLDPLGRRMVRDVIAELAGQGVTVFLNSHLLGEVEATCTRVAFIRQGRVIATESLCNLAQRCSRLTLDVGDMSPAVFAELKAKYPELERVADGKLHLLVSSRDEVAALTRWLVERDVAVFGIVPEAPTLEDLFVEIMGEGAAE